MRRTTLSLGLLWLALFVSCGNGRVCGDGTIERDGVCVGSGITIGPEYCAMGTKLEDGRCVPVSPPTSCDPADTFEEVDPITGAVTCHANCGDPVCLGVLPCPQSTVGKSSYCGTLIDVATNQTIALDGFSGAFCDSAQPADYGPCALRLKVFEASDFMNAPSTAVALVAAEISVDECGRFRIANVPTPPSGQVVLVTESPNTSIDPLYTTTATIVVAQSAQSKNNVPVYAVPASADASWTASAGLGAPGFAERGAYLGLFTDSLVPVAGVSLTRDGATVADDDYYFADTNPSSRLAIDPDQNETGLNGAGLVINSALTNHAGTGPSSLTCTWRSVTAQTVPGVVFVQNHTCAP